MKLNLGCGSDKRDGYINLDKEQCDLNKYPYPFLTESADEILLYHVLEHLKSPIEVIKECQRILKPQGVLKIKMPHFSNRYGCHSDPTHKHIFTLETFTYFKYGEYIKYPHKSCKDLSLFYIKKMRLTFDKGLWLHNYLVEPLINLIIMIDRRFYETTILHRIFAAKEMKVELWK